MGYWHFEIKYAAALYLFLVQQVSGLLELFMVKEIHRNSTA